MDQRQNDEENINAEDDIEIVEIDPEDPNGKLHKRHFEATLSCVLIAKISFKSSTSSRT